MQAISETAKRAIAAYGGQALWQQAERVVANVSVHGLAVTLKGRTPFQRATVRCDVQRPRSSIRPIGTNPDVAGILEGGDVRLEDRGGQRLAERGDARMAFPSLRRQFRWDDLDMAYFANYAFWNYLTLPALLMSEQIQWREVEAGKLDATFPSSLPTHCPRQRFHFDVDTGLLRQHDYTAQIIGRFARAAHVIESHAVQDGLCFPNQRRVSPRGPSGRPLGWPTLIAITVHDYRVETR